MLGRLWLLLVNSLHFLWQTLATDNMEAAQKDLRDYLDANPHRDIPTVHGKIQPTIRLPPRTNSEKRTHPALPNPIISPRKTPPSQRPSLLLTPLSLPGPSGLPEIYLTGSPRPWEKQPSQPWDFTSESSDAESEAPVSVLATSSGDEEGTETFWGTPRMVKEPSNSRLEGIPTAHVRPHAASQPLSSGGMELQLRRAQSTDYLAADMLPLVSPAAQSPGRPWGSVQNLPGADHPGEFKCLDKDLEQTVLYDHTVNGMDYMNLNNYPTDLPMTHRSSQYHTPSVGYNPSDFSHMRNPHTNSLHRDYRTDQPPSSMPSHLTKDLFNTHGSFATPHKGMSRAASLSVLPTQGAVYAQSTMVTPGMLSGNYDMTSWQVRHQEQLQGQQVDMSQGIYPSEVSLPSVSDPAKLDSVQWAHSQALIEKNRIISSNKQRISMLEQQQDAGYSQTMMKHIQDDRDRLSKILQEFQVENSHLKAQLKKQEGSQSAAEKKLGEREFELQNYKESVNREMTSRNVEVRMLKEKLTERDKSETEWKEKFQKLQADYEVLHQKDKSTERYLADVPTAQDLATMKSELQSLKEDKQKYKARVKDMERRLNEANQAVRARDSHLENLRQDMKKEKSTNDTIKGENNVLRNKLGLPVDTSVPFKPLDDVDELKEENKRLESKCEAAKKFVDLHYQKLQSERQSHTTLLHELRERLEQEEATGAGLRVQLLEQDTLISKQRESLREYGRANQDYKIQNLTLKERIAELERQGCGEIAKLERRLHKELAVCFSELYSLVQICVQRAEGQDPNISVLLGVKATTGLDQEQEQPEKESSVAALKQKLSKIKELRQEVDKLREIVSNKYAEDLANNLTCATQ